jgi:YaiO family outer membrane protein
LLLVAALAVAPLGASGAQERADSRRELARPNSATVEYGYVDYLGDIDPWQLASLSVGRRAALGSVIARANWADRFGSTGVQVEGDAYPSLGAGRYAYVNVGYSADGVFPAWRWGAELFTSLPRAWEASLGARQLRFDGVPVTLFTGSVGRYVGNYWISLRPYAREKEGALSASASVTARRYFADADHYVGTRVGYGSTPSDRLAPEELARTSSFSAGVHGSTGVTRSMLLVWSLNHDVEELGRDRRRRSIGLSTGLRVVF